MVEAEGKADALRCTARRLALGNVIDPYKPAAVLPANDQSGVELDLLPRGGERT